MKEIPRQRPCSGCPWRVIVPMLCMVGFFNSHDLTTHIFRGNLFAVFLFFLSKYVGT